MTGTLKRLYYRASGYNSLAERGSRFFSGGSWKNPKPKDKLINVGLYTYIERNMRPERQRNAAAARASSRNVT
jgi:hypothetical protein